MLEQRYIDEMIQLAKEARRQPRRGLVKCVCSVCGTVKERAYSYVHAKPGRGKYCSQRCMHAKAA